MRKTSAKSEASRQRIVEAAGQEFRKNGLGGIGVDGLAKSADLTSGAFYFHFNSKMDVFVASLRYSLAELRNGIRRFQEEQGKGWLAAFVEYYLGFKRTCDLTEGCSLPALSPEVERAGNQARSVYEEEVLGIVNTIAAGLPAGKALSRRDRALVIMALLSGGVNMARAVKSEAFAEEIAEAIRKAALSLK
jgi:AcrR family transcriptional regulator